MRQLYETIYSRLTFDQMVVSLVCSDPDDEKSPIYAAYPYVVSFGIVQYYLAETTTNCFRFQSEVDSWKKVRFIYCLFLSEFYDVSQHAQFFLKKFFCALTQTHRHYYDLFIAGAPRLCYILILCNSF